jgi:hypothetical protein
MATAYLSKTLPDAHGGVYKWTYSFWVKRGTLGTTQVMVGSRNSGTYYSQIKFTSADDLEVNDYRATSYALQKVTDRKFRDTSAWYHIVISNDNSVSSPDLKIYVNGVEETSFSTDNEYSQNQSTSFNNSYPNYIGQKGTGDYFDGLMTHVNFVDGTALTPTSFGQSDSNGVWIPKPSPSVTYGTNGFFLKMDNSGNMGLDSSGNSNNFTTSGTITQAKDTPSNVFATLNPLATSTTSGSFSNGNTTHAKSNSTWASTTSTLAASSGKYYAEYKFTVNSSSSNGQMAAIVNMDLTNYMNENSDLEQNGNKGITYYANGTVFADNQQTVATYGSYTNNIIQIAMDLDNGFLYFGKDGVWQNSANPASGATGTGGINISNYLGTGTFAFGLANRNTGSTSVNFGNGYFGTTAVSSAGTNASGNGIFEYDVPTGYTALSTKGLDS